jgi:hypothetical protein
MVHIHNGILFSHKKKTAKQMEPEDIMLSKVNQTWTHILMFRKSQCIMALLDVRKGAGEGV